MTEESPDAIVLRKRLTIERLSLLQEILSESHGTVPLWAFLASALLRSGHGPLAVAKGFSAPVRLDASSADPVTGLADLIGDPGETACLIVDLSGEAIAGGALPLPDAVDIQIALGAPYPGAAGREVEISVMARAKGREAPDVARLLTSLAAALESPGVLLSNLPEV
ncbi:hypothetical protein [Roseivivax halodurans]|nr:hypothetical protein [Roseivivax halodurans]